MGRQKTLLTPRTIELNDEFLHCEGDFFQSASIPYFSWQLFDFLAGFGTIDPSQRMGNIEIFAAVIFAVIPDRSGFPIDPGDCDSILTKKLISVFVTSKKVLQNKYPSNFSSFLCQPRYKLQRYISNNRETVTDSKIISL